MSKKRHRPTPKTPIRDHTIYRIPQELVSLSKDEFEPLSPEETRLRIVQRIRYQDEIVLPKRQKEGPLSPAWRKYRDNRSKERG